MKKRDFYLTTPLYYVNAKPHIGHAYTNILTDTFSRFHLLRGEGVFFLTGTDEHGTKIQKTAQEAGQTPKEFVDSMVPIFKSLWTLLGIEYHYFIRTTDEQHKRIVGRILTNLLEKGDLYKASYKGWYCTPCESFWTQMQLAEGLCPDCHREVQELSEENYFFKLSQYQPWLIQYIEKHPDFIRPEMRKNEILGFLKQPLEDLCITRPRARLSWGIDFPSSPEHVIYVWFDALINYISAIGYTENADFEQRWPADVHFIGKDILRQHAVYWPIMLKAMGLPMPKTVLAHGWWTMAGSKVSKSRGNSVDPVDLVQKYGVDPFRYFLLKEVTLGFDGAFSEELLRERYTTDLANDLGNLWFRLASMLGKYFDGKIPEAKIQFYGDPLLKQTLEMWTEVQHAMEHLDPRAGLTSLFQVIRRANQYVEEHKPWALAKQAGQSAKLAQVLRTLAECTAHVAVVLLAFLPTTAAQILGRFQLPVKWTVSSPLEFQKPFLTTGTAVERGAALFPKLEEIAPETPS